MAQQWVTLEDLIKQLSPMSRKQVYDFAQSLLQKQNSPTKNHFKFDWEGALSDLRDQYTSVELQHDTTRHWDEEQDVSS